MRFSLIGIIGVSILLTSHISLAQEKHPAIEIETMCLIPAGTFQMGSEDYSDTKPVHEVAVSAFYMDAHEVTNAQYYKFCQETDRALPEFWDMEPFHCGIGFPNHPVLGITWADAKAYATWAGKRLPTEAEWEYAARGGLLNQRYPNGDDINPDLANITWKGKRHGTVPVGSYQPNAYRLYDMAGNVNEWVTDYYSFDYYGNSEKENPKGPER